jgi:hypothetical protein
VRDRYFGNANTKPQLDPKMGPRAKLYATNSGNIRPYIGAEVLHREELLIGLGVIYYLSESSSIEIGYRDSVYETTHYFDERDSGNRDDQWLQINPLFFLGGVIRW